MLLLLLVVVDNFAKAKDRKIWTLISNSYD